MEKTQKEVILKSFGTGQITLPKPWRTQFRSPYFRAIMQKKSLVISPVDDGNPLGLPEVNEKIHEPGYTTIIDPKKVGYPNGIPAEIFLKALRASIERDKKKKKYGSNAKATGSSRRNHQGKN